MSARAWHEICASARLPNRSRTSLLVPLAPAAYPPSTMRPRLTRPTFLALAALVLAPVSALASDVKLVRVWPDYRTAASFVRIAEYFGGQESSPEIIVRTQPEERAGYYFLTRFESDKALPGSIIALEYTVPGDEAARVQFLPVDLPAGSRAFMAGVTGADWPDAKTAPTAWRLRLLGPSGDELARTQSFLWSLPPAPTTNQPAAEPEAPVTTVPVAAPTN